MKQFLTTILILFVGSIVYAQSNNSQLSTSIRADGADPDDSAILDVQSTTQGMLVPRMTSTQRIAISMPASGLLVYDTNTPGFWFYDGAAWVSLSGGGGGGGPQDHIVDADGDTSVEVDDGSDNDEIIFKVADGSGGSIDAFSVEYDPTLDNARISHSAIDNNLFIGRNTGENNDANHVNNGGRNTFIGVDAGEANVEGGYNTFVGFEAGQNATSDFNTFVGSASGIMATGTSNTFLGATSGNNNTSGYSNTFIGRNTGYANTTGSDNIFLGAYAGAANSTAWKNIFIGKQAGANTTTGSGNIFIGKASGFDHIDGYRNIFMGEESGRFVTDGIQNLLLGFRSGYNMTTGGNNIFLGSNAGEDNDDGSRNVCIGINAGKNFVNGWNNVMLGTDAGSNNNGGNNVFLGNSAGYNETGSHKLYISNTLTSAPLIYGEFNTQRLRINGQLSVGDPAFGNADVYAFPTVDGADGEVLTTNGSGAVTWEAAEIPLLIEDADGDTYVEVDNGSDHDLIYFWNGNSTGSSDLTFSMESDANSNARFIPHGANTFIGQQTGPDNDPSDPNNFGRNTFIGNYSGASNTIGHFNTFIGSDAGYENTTGDYNTFLGVLAGEDNQGGVNNVYLGTYAGAKAVSGSDNVYAGYGSGYNGTGFRNVFLGRYAGYSETGNNKLYIESTISSAPLIYGEFDNNLLRVNGKLAIGDPNIANTSFYTFPTADGSNGEVLTTDGSGNVTWEAGGASDELVDADGDTRVMVEAFPDDDKIRLELLGDTYFFIEDNGFGQGRIRFDEGAVLLGSFETGNASNSPTNVMIGNAAGKGNTRWSNTLVGQGAGQDNVNGVRNAYLGTNSGQFSSGSRNVMLGYNSGASNTGSDNVFIGYEAGKGITGSDKLVIEGSDDIVTPLIYGEFDNDYLQVNGTLEPENIGIGTNSPGASIELNTTTPAKSLLIKSSNANATGIEVDLTQNSTSVRGLWIKTEPNAISAELDGIMRLTPQSSAPSSPTKGMIYMDDGLSKLRYYNGSGWINL